MKYCILILGFSLLGGCALVDLKPENPIRTVPSRDYEVLTDQEEITIFFTEEVDQFSIESITSLSRNGLKIETDYLWEEKKQMIIEANDTLLRGLEYRLEISGIYSNSSGDERDVDLSIPFYIETSSFEPLEVLFSIPEDRSIYKNDGTLIISFNKAVDKSTLNKSLNITPPLDTTLTWSDDIENTLIIEADDGWSNLTYYTISMDDTLCSQKGDPLYPDWDLTFFIDDGDSIPSVLYCGSCDQDYLSDFPWISTDLESLVNSQGIRIRFSEEMNPELTESSFNMTPPIAGDFYWRDSDLIFSPRQAFDPSQSYRLEIGKEAESRCGIGMRDNFIVDFRPALQNITVLSLECSSQGGFILHNFSSVKAVELPIQEVTPFDLCFHFTFSEPFSSDSEKQNVQDSLSFYELFSSGGTPDISLFSWSTDYIMTVILSGFPGSPDREFYYLMELEGGLQGIQNSDGSYMQGSVSQLFRVGKQ